MNWESLMQPLILPMVKIALLIFVLMTAAAYLVLLERWIAAWVQDRQGPNRISLSKLQSTLAPSSRRPAVLPVRPPR